MVLAITVSSIVGCSLALNPCLKSNRTARNPANTKTPTRPREAFAARLIRKRAKKAALRSLLLDQGHSAFRAPSRLVLDDLWMHRAGIQGLTFRMWDTGPTHGCTGLFGHLLTFGSRLLFPLLGFP